MAVFFVLTDYIGGRVEWTGWVHAQAGEVMGAKEIIMEEKRV